MLRCPLVVVPQGSERSLHNEVLPQDEQRVVNLQPVHGRGKRARKRALDLQQRRHQAIDLQHPRMWVLARRPLVPGRSGLVSDLRLLPLALVPFGKLVVPHQRREHDSREPPAQDVLAQQEQRFRRRPADLRP